MWVPVDGWPWYEVSNHGRVRRAVPGPATRSGRVLTGGKVSGYPTVTLRGEGGAQASFLVHHLVATAFLPPCPGEHGAGRGRLQLDHINGDRRDNRAANLRWVTYRQNEANKKRLGRTARGEGHGCAVLDCAAVVSIREAYATGDVSQAELADRFGVAHGTIGQVVRGRNWSHVGGPRTEGRRGPVARGEANGNARLTVEDVREIRKRYGEGDISQATLGRDYGVTKHTVSHIINRKTWRHV